MAKIEYSKELCNNLFNAANNPVLKCGHRRMQYEVGDELTLQIKGIYPAIKGSASITIDEFLGGGFAGQAYRVRLAALNLPAGRQIPGLEAGKLYVVKIAVPSSAFSKWVRNTVYWLAFQGSFSPQVNYSACRSGLILQKLVRRAAKIKFGRETAIKDAYASFYDDNLNSYGEITEWIEGRMWQMEADDELKGRRNWKTVSLTETGSPEYIAKRRFMADMVGLLHEMGAQEAARQYEWWTMRSQSNVIKRTDLSEPSGPGDGLCAIDFRPGLALLPWLPMSPGDIKLIFDGIFKRGTLVQFDRCDFGKMEPFFKTHAAVFADMQSAIDELFEQDRAYRRSLPNITHHGSTLLADPKLLKSVRAGLIEGWLVAELIDRPFAEKLESGGLRFISFYLLGAFPILGKMTRMRWGNTVYREHIRGILNDGDYRKTFLLSFAANGLILWHRTGRADEKRTEFLMTRPRLFLFEKLTLGFLPVRLHQRILHPIQIWQGLRDNWHFSRKFMGDREFRKRRIADKVAAWQRGRLANKIPFFGKPGDLLEHWIFDALFNLPHWVSRTTQPTLKQISSHIQRCIRFVWGHRPFPAAAHTFLSKAHAKKCALRQIKKQ